MRRILPRFLFALVLLAGGAALVLPPFLASWVEGVLVARLSGQPGITDFRCRVNRVGLFGALLTDIRVGAPGAGQIIHSLRLAYTPAGLLDGRLETVSINGVRLTVDLSDGRLLIPGLDRRQSATAWESSAGGPAFPVLPGRVSLHGGTLVVRRQSGTLYLPFELSMTAGRPDAAGNGIPVYNAELELYPGGHQVHLSASVDLRNNHADLRGVVDDASVADIVETAGMDQAAIAGRIDLGLTADLELSPFAIARASLAGEVRNPRLSYQGVQAGAVSGADREGRVHFDLKGGRRQWRFTVSDLAISRPLAAGLALDGEMRFEKNGTVLNGTMELDFPAGRPVYRGGPQFVGPVRLTGPGSLELEPGGTWRLDATAALPSPWRARLGEVEVGSREAGMRLHGEGRGLAGAVEADLRFSGLSAQAVSFSAKVPEPVANTKIRFSEALAWTGEFQLVFEKMEMRRDKLFATGDLDLTGTVSIPSPAAGAVHPGLAGRLEVRNGGLEAEDLELGAGGISGAIPWQWPGDNDTAAGQLSVDTVSWQGRELGGLDMTVRQDAHAWGMTGRHASNLVPGLALRFDGRIFPGEKGVRADGRLQVPSFPLAGWQLRSLTPAAGDLRLSGAASAAADFTLTEAGTFRGGAVLHLAGGELESRNRELHIEDIDLKLEFNELPYLRSAHAQRLTFGALSLGTLRFTDGVLDYRLESPRSLFVEKSGISWAGGYVYAPAFRIEPRVEEYAVTLYCDRLKLPAILEQFGLSRAEGGGEVNGRLPLHYGRGRLRFDDGFLYSTPGVGGTLRLAASSVLTAGVPADSPRFSQLDFAAAALKEFQYDWVTLLVNSEGEELVVRMQLDGRPEKPLPFTYRRENGSFVRLEDQAGPGIDRPIRLDVNFRFPLDTILGYSGGIRELMDRIRQ